MTIRYYLNVPFDHCMLPDNFHIAIAKFCLEYLKGAEVRVHNKNYSVDNSGLLAMYEKGWIVIGSTGLGIIRFSPDMVRQIYEDEESDMNILIEVDNHRDDL